MNLLSSLLKYTADQIAALRAKNTSQDTTVSGIDTRLGTAEGKVTNMEAQLATAISAVTVDSEVQNVRVGDDNVTYASAGEAVRKQFSAVKSDLNNYVDLFSSPIGLIDENNLLLGKQIHFGKYYDYEDNVNANTSYIIVPVVQGTEYTFLGVRFLSDGSALVGNYANYAEVHTWVATITGNAYVSIHNSFLTTAFFCTTAHYSSEDYGTISTPIYNKNTLAQGTGISEKKPISQKAFTSLSSKIAIHYIGNIFPLRTDQISGYYLAINGALDITLSASFCGFIIKVNPNTTYSFSSGRFVVLLDSEKTPLPVQSGYAHYENVTSVNSGNAEYLAISFSIDAVAIADYVISEGSLNPSAYSEYNAFANPEPLNSGKLPYYKITGNLDGTNYLYNELNRTELRKNARVIFSGDFISFNSLTISRRYANSNKNYIVINGSTVSYYSSSGATPVSVQHGLTIANTIKVILEQSEVKTLKITIYSNDGNGSNIKFEHTFDGYTSNAGVWAVTASSAMTNCSLVWTSTDINLPIWFFGDSYLQYSAERWTYYMHELGYDKNVLMSGWAGESSNNGCVALEYLLLFGSPEFVVWAYGMNDETDSESEPSEWWETYRDRFISDCEANDVTPIFCTIPTVPSINHEQKNAWIRSSGYRYIDFAKAVGANSSGVWYSGMLSSDNVHPTAYGAEALCSQVLIDFPEIMLKR